MSDTFRIPFSKFKPQVLDNLEVETTSDEDKGILQGDNFSDKLKELETMIDNSPRKFKRKYRNTDNSFSSRMNRLAQEKYK
jgi:hypothetical protein